VGKSRLQTVDLLFESLFFQSGYPGLQVAAPVQCHPDRKTQSGADVAEFEAIPYPVIKGVV